MPDVPTTAPATTTAPKNWLFWSDVLSGAVFALSQTVDSNISSSAAQWAFLQQIVGSIVSRAMQSNMWAGYQAIGSEQAKRYIISSIVSTVLAMYSNKKKATVSTFLNSAGASAVCEEIVLSFSNVDKAIW
jgi:hypothetical protein